MKLLAISNNLSSVHINFLTCGEASDLAGKVTPLKVVRTLSIEDEVKKMLERIQVKDDFLRRTSIQYHWTNSNPKNDGKPFESFEDYLSCFKSKRQTSIRRERQKVLTDESIRIDPIVGRDIVKCEGLVDRMFEIYSSTIDKQVCTKCGLTPEFGENVVFMVARRNSTAGETLRAKDVFAGTFSKYRHQC